MNAEAGDALQAPKKSVSAIQRLLQSTGQIARRQGWTNPFLIAMGLGLVSTILVASSRCGESETACNRLQTVGVALLVALAAVASGALLGFLFGIPRAGAGDATSASKTFEWQRRPYAPNTNLEQISDWLTKIVVALGLAQLTRIPSEYESLANYVSRAFGEQQVPPSLAAVMLAYYAILGFLVTYLWTRLFLSGEFNRVDGQAQDSPEFLEGLIQALLYQEPPLGYTKAIEYSQQYLQLYGDQNWRIWRSLACAYGQQYGNLDDADKKSAKGLAARDKALEATKRVLGLNPREKEGIKALWDKNLATPQENDLTPFYDDADFKKLLGS